PRPRCDEKKRGQDARATPRALAHDSPTFRTSVRRGAQIITTFQALAISSTPLDTPVLYSFVDADRRKSQPPAPHRDNGNPGKLPSVRRFKPDLAIYQQGKANT